MKYLLKVYSQKICSLDAIFKVHSDLEMTLEILWINKYLNKTKANLLQVVGLVAEGRCLNHHDSSDKQGLNRISSASQAKTIHHQCVWDFAILQWLIVEEKT